jgi:hypothetical protein
LGSSERKEDLHTFGDVAALHNGCVCNFCGGFTEQNSKFTKFSLPNGILPFQVLSIFFAWSFLVKNWWAGYNKGGSLSTDIHLTTHNVTATKRIRGNMGGMSRTLQASPFRLVGWT